MPRPRTRSCKAAKESTNLLPPHRKHGTWIPKGRVAEFIGSRGTNVRRLSSQTKVQCIKVMEEEVHTTSDGLEEGDSDNAAQPILDETTKGSSGNTAALKIMIEAPSKAAASTSSQAKSCRNLTQNVERMAKSSPRSAAPSPTSTMEPLEETTRYNLTAEGNFDPVIQHINTSAGIRPIGPPSKSKIPHAAKRVVVPSPLQIGRTSTIPGLMEFLTKNVGFFKTPPNAFSDYLTSMDIESIRDLAEAVEDDDVMAGSMRMVLRNSRKARSSKPFLQSRL